MTTWCSSQVRVSEEIWYKTKSKMCESRTEKEDFILNPQILIATLESIKSFCDLCWFVQVDFYQRLKIIF